MAEALCYTNEGVRISNDDVITSSTSDEQLKTWANEIEKTVEDMNILIDGDMFSYLKELREEER